MIVIRGLSPRVRGNLLHLGGILLRLRSIPARAGEPPSSPCSSPPPSVYPRACGGTMSSRRSSMSPSGLSPRVRGNPRLPPRAGIRTGSIPARAGEPVPRGPGALQPGVYPRACGGTQHGPPPRWRSSGLSPRVRGNPAWTTAALAVLGSIPARAGEPSMDHRRAGGPRVYPRACGGTISPLHLLRLPWGLSPRVRGNRRLIGSSGNEPGSIPARAGEPRASGSSAAIPSVYPRACGGTRQGNDVGSAASGLSPRVRGNPCRLRRRLRRRRSIPARAGEPLTRPHHQHTRRVYPRACGGTRRRGPAAKTGSGLSPRVRGNHVRHGRQREPGGSIPARAGEPIRCPPHNAWATVYPRACGGTSAALLTEWMPTGLSPRVRGNHDQQVQLAVGQRSIPARAGEPSPYTPARNW